MGLGEEATILLIGGTGFIGKNLCVELSHRRVSALVVSRDPDESFLERYAPTVKAVNVEKFRRRSATLLRNIETVVYLAGRSTPATRKVSIETEIDVAIRPLLWFIEELQTKCDCSQIIYVSSGGAIYGNAGARRVDETCEAKPISVYGLGKLMSENMLRFQERSGGIPTTILRAANPVGQWQASNEQGVVTALLRAAVHGHPFDMVGRGLNIRDYFAVEDLIQAIILAAEGSDRCVGQTFNVGSGVGLSVLDVYELVCSITGVRIPVRRHPARDTDVDGIVLDTSKIEDALGWKPEIPLEQKIANMWNSMQQEGLVERVPEEYTQTREKYCLHWQVDCSESKRR